MIISQAVDQDRALSQHYHHHHLRLFQYQPTVTLTPPKSSAQFLIIIPKDFLHSRPLNRSSHALFRIKIPTSTVESNSDGCHHYPSRLIASRVQPLQATRYRHSHCPSRVCHQSSHLTLSFLALELPIPIAIFARQWLNRGTLEGAEFKFCIHRSTKRAKSFKGCYRSGWFTATLSFKVISSRH